MTKKLPVWTVAILCVALEVLVLLAGAWIAGNVVVGTEGAVHTEAVGEVQVILGILGTAFVGGAFVILCTERAS